MVGVDQASSGSSACELDLGLGQLLGGNRVGARCRSRRKVRDLAAQQRAAQRHAELAVLGQVGPAHRRRRTSRGRGPRARGSAAPPRRTARRPRRASGAAARPARARAAARRSCARIGVARCCTFCTFTSTGLVGGRHPHAHRLERALDPPRHDRLLLAVLRARAAAARPGGRPRPGRRCGAWCRPARRSAPARRRGAPAARGWRPRTPPPACRRSSSSRPGTRSRSAPKHRRRVDRRARVHAHLARQHDLLELAGADPLHRAPHRLLVVRGRRRARHPRRARPGRGRAAASSPGRSSVEPRERRQRSAIVPTGTVTVSRASPPRRASETSGSTSCAGANDAHSGVRPPSGANAKPPTNTGPGAGQVDAGRPPASRGRAPRSALGRVARTGRAPRLDHRGRAQRRRREAVAVGLLEAEEAVVAPAAPRGRPRRGRVAGIDLAP